MRVRYDKLWRLMKDIMKPVYNFKASDDDLPWKKKKVNTDEGTDCQETETD